MAELVVWLATPDENPEGDELAIGGDVVTPDG